jgi:dihydrofolate reductase
MKVILYIATSIDGYISSLDWDSDWVSDADGEIFDDKIQDAWCIVVWNTTYEQYKWELYPIDWVVNIVISSQEIENTTQCYFVKSIDEALEIAKSEWIQEILLIGWGITNASFLKENCIDEIILSLHPIILGKWKKIFEDIEVMKHLKLQESKKINNELIYIHYKVIK